MKTFLLLATVALGTALTAVATTPTKDAEFKVTATTKVGGDGGWDYVNADSAGRKLYIARGGKTPVVNVYDLDSLKPVGSLPGVQAHGAVIDTASGHGFCSSSPVTMFDSNTLKPIKTIAVDGRPDGMLDDPYNSRVYVFSHSAPNVTVIDAKDGSVLGTIDLGGAPEEAATDGAGKIYVDIEDKDQVAVIDADSMKVTADYGLDGKGGGPGGLALDPKNNILFVACHDPATMVMLDAKTGKVLGSVPIGQGCDGAGFDPVSGMAFSSQGDGTLTVVREKSSTEFEVAQTVKTAPGARTMTIDTKLGRVFVVTAEFGKAQPAQQGQRFQRRPLIPGSFKIITVSRPMGMAEPEG